MKHERQSCNKVFYKVRGFCHTLYHIVGISVTFIPFVYKLDHDRTFASLHFALESRIIILHFYEMPLSVTTWLTKQNNVSYWMWNRGSNQNDKLTLKGAISCRHFTINLFSLFAPSVWPFGSDFVMHRLFHWDISLCIYPTFTEVHENNTASLFSVRDHAASVQPAPSKDCLRGARLFSLRVLCPLPCN